MRTDAAGPLPEPWTLEGASRELRRQLRPMAWTVLCGIGDHARHIDGEIRAAVSVRTLAAELGLSKNAVNRAVKRLRDHGVIVDHRQARSNAGEYGTSYYVIAFVREAEPSLRQAQPTRHQVRVATSIRRQVEQLSLFPPS